MRSVRSPQPVIIAAPPESNALADYLCARFLPNAPYVQPFMIIPHEMDRGDGLLVAAYKIRDTHLSLSDTLDARDARDVYLFRAKVCYFYEFHDRSPPRHGLMPDYILPHLWLRRSHPITPRPHRVTFLSYVKWSFCDHATYVAYTTHSAKSVSAAASRGRLKSGGRALDLVYRARPPCPRRPQTVSIHSSGASYGASGRRQQDSQPPQSCCRHLSNSIDGQEGVWLRALGASVDRRRHVVRPGAITALRAAVTHSNPADHPPPDSRILATGSEASARTAPVAFSFPYQDRSLRPSAIAVACRATAGGVSKLSFHWSLSSPPSPSRL
jgi:hypothetical protein